jgi:histidinol dehydrogenase
MNVVREADLTLWLETVESRRRQCDEQAASVAQRIVEDVRQRGDRAVVESLLRFDGIALQPEELLTSPMVAAVSPDLAAAIEMACGRIQRFHSPQLPRGYSLVGDDGVLQHEVRPLRRVAVYVPGGAATYISTLLMCAIPARLAGVTELLVVTTPRAASTPSLQYACVRLGVTQIYRCGGAAGVAAAAYGTESLARVDKIVGPGNAYVSAAKQLVRGAVSVDLIAGPSEIIVLADDAADPELVAADLLAQAEHGADSATICLTTSPRFAGELVAIIDRRLPEAPGAAASMASNGAVVVVGDLARAIALINRIAPEHLEVMIKDPDAILDSIENCAAIYVGAASGVALGDYAVGTNHVLPTSGSARFASPLGTYDFVKRRNVVRLSEAGAAEIAGTASLLASAEGLPLHARSCDARVNVNVGGRS